MSHIANQRLAALVDVDMLDADILRSPATEATEDFYLHRISLQ